jgi:hypothetical protein
MIAFPTLARADSNLFRDFSSLNPQRSPNREGRVNAEKEDGKLQEGGATPPVHPHLVHSSVSGSNIPSIWYNNGGPKKWT